jgi:hypothetical protein
MMAHLEDEIRPDYWPEPEITPQCGLFTGFLAGSLDRSERRYRAIGLSNPLEILDLNSGARFRVTVEQISGDE